MLLRPRGSAEWMWAGGAAVLLVALRLVAPATALRAVGRGADVYCFLAGMMLLAETARRAGVFDWVAGHAAHAARGSRWRLFALVYGAGVLVTIVLSNDATAVVLTPAVAAVVRRVQAPPLPHLYACAFVANAASFVLPISNPANLVIYGGALPTLGPWLAAFALPSLLAVLATFGALGFATRTALRGTFAVDPSRPALRTTGRLALGAIAGTAAALVAASAHGAPLGTVTLIASTVGFTLVTWSERKLAWPTLRSITWSVLVLVAGLFVLVAALDETGLLDLVRRGLDVAAGWPGLPGALALGAATAVASNVANNLPAGLIAGTALSHLGGHATLREATAVGIDLGPNFSVTGSLATVLWLAALRREKVAVSASAFLRVGLLVTPPALALALLALGLTGAGAR